MLQILHTKNSKQYAHPDHFAGLIWNKMPTDFDNWEVELTFKVAGRGRVGADGLVSSLVCQ